jgi:hypothetical protein
MMSDAILISEILALPDEGKAEIAEHVERLKKASRGESDTEKHPHRRAGSMPGKFVIMPDFDDPLEEFEEYM